MNLDLIYPSQQEGFSFDNLQGIPNKAGQFSGYYLISLIRSYFTTTSGARSSVDRYVCFTNETKDQVWIEKLSFFNHKKWIVFEDTVKIDNNEEFNEVLSFLKERKILE